MTAVSPVRWPISAAPADAPPGCCSDISCTPGGQAMPWLRLIVGLFVAGQTMILALAINLTPPDDARTRLLLQSAMLAATAIVFAMLGLPLVRAAASALRHRRLTLELLFLASLSGALAYSLGSMVRGEGSVYFEVVSIVLVIYTLGRAVGAVSRHRAMAAMTQLTASLAIARDEHGRAAPVESIAVGQRVLVAPGERIAVDGIVVRGAALVRETEYTGATVGVRRGPGDPVRSGTMSLDGALVVEATSPGSDRQIDALLARLDAARLAPTHLQRQADRFVAWFLPLVALAAGGALAWWSLQRDVETGLMAAMAVLLIACPCAAGLATPLVMWSVLGRLAQRGLVLRGGDVIERLADADSVIFDKTGTLGEPRLALERFDVAADAGTRTCPVAAIVAAVERHCRHPVAEALRGLAGEDDAAAVAVHAVQVLPGRGVAAQVTAEGRRRSVEIVRDDASRIRVRIDGNLAATAVLRERLRDDAAACVAALEDLGLSVRVMTGDADAGDAAALADADAGMTPEGKLAAVRQLQRDDRRFSRPVFVGDGLNDAAAMTASHVGVALAEGSAITVEAADATLHGGDLTRLPQAIALARRAVGLVRSHLAWAATYNLVGIAVAAAGLLHPVFAALLMAGSSAFVSLRSLRLAGSLDAPPRPRVEAPLRSAAKRRAFAVLHLLGIVGQGLVLSRILGLGAIDSALTVAAFACAAGWLLLAWPWMSRGADMIFAMLSLGGLGMNAGWWADLGFTAAPPHHGCCAAALGAGPAGALSWMNAGMLALGVPAMLLMLRRRQPLTLRDRCCRLMLVLGVPAMVGGMMAGSFAASTLAANWPATAAGLLDYALMMAGMAAGMILPHALHREAVSLEEAPAPRSTRPVASP